MGISGIYAATAQITNGQIITGGVDINIETFKLNDENSEVKYEDDNKTVMPGEVVSFIPKIANNGEGCYVRVKLFFIDESTDLSKYITGISSEWEKYGDYYYYKKVLNPEESVKLFDTIQIPSNLDESLSNQKVKLEITAEAIQEKNFEPDYTKNDPWQGIVPVKNVNKKYDIETNNNSNITIKYENGADEDIEVPSNFFENMEKIMPGDSHTSSIEIKNTNKKNAKYYLELNLDGINENKIELLEQLDLEITNKNGQVAYSGKIKNGKKILLGEYNIGDEDKLDFKIIAPVELENKYAYLNSKLDFIFSVDYDKENAENKESNDINSTNPKTGDKINVAITMFVISSVGLVVVMLLDYREKRNIE